MWDSWVLHDFPLPAFLSSQRHGLMYWTEWPQALTGQSWKKPRKLEMLPARQWQRSKWYERELNNISCYQNLLAHSNLVGRAHVSDCAKVKFCRCRRDFFISKWNETLNANLVHFFLWSLRPVNWDKMMFYFSLGNVSFVWFFFFSDFILLGALSGVGKM